MKRILFLVILFAITLNLLAQINTSTVQGIDCYNDTGIIALDANITFPSTVIWEYKSGNVWSNINTSLFASLSLTLDTLSTTQCGLYRVSFWYNNTSQAQDSFFVACPVSMGQGQEPILCYGDSSGILKRPVFGGIPYDPNNSILLNNLFDGDEYYSYAWKYADDSLGTNSFILTDTTENLNNVSAGWYQTIVTDAIGCSDSIGYILFNNPQEIRIDSIIINENKCIGDSLATVFLKVVGGKKFSASNKYFYYLTLNSDTIAFSDTSGYSSNFSNLSSSNNIQSYFPDSIQFQNLIAGIYIFSIVDSNFCTIVDTIKILDPDNYQVYSSTLYPLLCASDTATFLIDSISGGNQNIDYYFLGFGNDTIDVVSGTYGIFVKDIVYGCVDTLFAICTAQYEIEVESIIDNVVCFGDSSGSILIDSIFGGNPPYTFQWGGINPQSLYAGFYTFVVVDSIGCSSSQNFIVEQPSQFSANADFYLPTCNGFLDGSIKINLSGGVGPLSYYWINGGGSLDSLYGLSSGIYQLVISDSLLCTDAISLVLNEPEQLDFNFTNYSNPLLCRGDKTTVDIAISGGTGPFSIMWDDGNIDLQRLLSSGINYCQVTDNNGCTSQNKQISIIEPDSFSIQSIISNNSNCDIGGDATVYTSGGADPIQYIWSTGEYTQSIDSLWGTDYWVIAIDSCGNSDTIYFNLISSNLTTELSYDSITHIGFVTIVDGGGPFSYAWKDVGGNIISTDSFTLLCEGSYFVTTTDVTSGCFVTDTILVSYNLTNGLINISNTTVLPNDSLWGANSYTYLWDNGEVLAHANICPGLHWIEVTDNFGCQVRQEFFIDPLLIRFDPEEIIFECNLENLDFELEAIVSGGTSPYTYEWSGGSTKNPLDVTLNPGNHSVTVMDNNACIEDTSFVIATMSSECVPNVFSPGNDDLNNTWRLENTFLFNDSEIRVYGRYGNLLFKSIGYEDAWDGRNTKGQDVPAGTYFYSIEIGHGFDVIKGSVSIFR